MATQLEQQPVNVLAPLKTKFADVDDLVIDKVTFSDGSTMTTASSGPYPSDIDCGSF